MRPPSSRWRSRRRSDGAKGDYLLPPGLNERRPTAERRLPELIASIERAELVRGWLEDAARCCCPTLDDCPLFEEPAGLPERRHALR